MKIGLSTAADLVAKLRGATEPSRDLDTAILLLVRPQAKLLPAPHLYEFEFEGGHFNVPFYTGSLDAARSLAPDGMEWAVGDGPGYHPPSASVGHWAAITAKDPICALCAAALQARFPEG